MHLQSTSRIWIIFTVSVVIGLMVACTCVPPQIAQGGKPTVVIVSPADGAEFLVGQLISVQVVATDSQGVSRVEMLADGTLVDTVNNPSPQPSFSATLSWTPNAPGIHVLVVMAYNVNGAASDPAIIKVNVKSSQAAGTVPVIQSFTASPPTITAGDSSTLSWAVTDATSVEIDQSVGSVALSGSQSVNPGSTTTYQLTAHGTGGDATATATVTVNPASGGDVPVINSFTANPPTIDAGNSSTLSWDVTGATSVEIDQGIGGVALSGSRSVSPGSTTTYQLTAHGTGGDATATAQVTVNPAPPAAPVVQSFTANPATINAGGSSTLQWAVTGATSVEINHGIGGVALSGSQSVNPASTTTYQLTAHGPGGDATATTQVTVNPAPPAAPVVQSFTANPATISAGGSSTLQWAVTGATSVEINHGIGGVALSGSQSVNPGNTTTYQLTAHGPGGDTTATAKVTVQPAPPTVHTWNHEVKLVGSRMIYHLLLTQPGQIKVRATWTGAQSSLAIIINGPGQTGYYARKDGSSPLEAAYTVSSADFAKGKHWRVTIASFGDKRAEGTVRITYPSGSSVTPFATQFTVDKDYVKAISLIVLKGPGKIEAQATWSGTPSNLALIINGPGQVGYYARKDGSSTLSTSYTVKASDLAAGDTWRVSLTSFSAANAEGTMRLKYP